MVLVAASCLVLSVILPEAERVGMQLASPALAVKAGAAVFWRLIWTDVHVLVPVVASRGEFGAGRPGYAQPESPGAAPRTR